MLLGYFLLNFMRLSLVNSSVINLTSINILKYRYLFFSSFIQNSYGLLFLRTKLILILTYSLLNTTKTTRLFTNIIIFSEFYWWRVNWACAVSIEHVVLFLFSFFQSLVATCLTCP